MAIIILTIALVVASFLGVFPLWVAFLPIGLTVVGYGLAFLLALSVTYFVNK